MKIKIGNIFESSAKTLVNTVNCVGVMGKGIALEFKTRYPQMFKQYVTLCKEGQIRPGEPYYYSDLLGHSIINFPTKDHWRSSSKLSYIEQGLDWFAQNYASLGINSVAFPPLGCGNGGLQWEIVGPLMYQKLKDLPIDIEIYAPFGTASEKLKIDYLEKAKANNTIDITGNQLMRINKKWLLILYVVQQLSQNRYSLTVGRVIFQKICYILTRTGIDTNFVFAKGSYGPYSKEVKKAVTILSNTNLMEEKKLGQMIAVTVTPNFSINFNDYSEQEILCVKKTIDLFSRVKCTEQAEMIATVLFSYDELSKEKTSQISEKDIYDYVIQWKPKWKNTKDEEISNSVRNLAILGWMKIQASTNLPFLESFF